MDGVFFAVLGIVMLGIIVVLLYLLDKVNTLESRANDGGFGSSLFGSAAPAVDNGFDGLSGQSLWDAVGGMSASGALSLDELNSLRQRYQPVLHKHILGVIEDAAKDADNGVARPPPTTRTVTTLRAEVQSWLPSQYLKNIYMAVFEAAQDPDQIPQAAASLDQACSALYERVEIDLARPYSVMVFGDVLDEGEPDDDNGAQTAQAALAAPAPDSAEPADGIAATPDAPKGPQA